MPAALYAKTNTDIIQKQKEMYTDAMDGKLDRFAPLGKVALGFARVPAQIEVVSKRTEEWAEAGGFQSEKFKVMELRSMAAELEVDISAAKNKMETATLLHKSLMESHGPEGGGCKFVLKRMGKSLGDEDAAFWDAAAAKLKAERDSAAVAMEVEAQCTSVA